MLYVRCCKVRQVTSLFSRAWIIEASSLIRTRTPMCTGYVHVYISSVLKSVKKENGGSVRTFPMARSGFDCRKTCLSTRSVDVAEQSVSRDFRRVALIALVINRCTKKKVS